MLSIDEAITHAREVAKRNREQWKNCTADRRDIEHQTCEQCAKEHEQLAEWLEELKALKNGLNIKCDSLNEALEKGKNIGYNKAIDDFVKELKDYFVIPHDVRVVEIKAEQLKKGGNINEQS